MKKTENIRGLFGITQDEMASLVGISRSHWSMFECGRRTLPLRAQERLAELLTKLQTVHEAKRPPITDIYEIQAYLEQLLCDNAYKQMCTLQKIEAKQAQHQAAKQRRLLLEALPFPPDEGKVGISQLIIRKPAVPKSDNQLMELMVQQELLAAEKLFLEQKMKTLLIQ